MAGVAVTEATHSPTSLILTAVEDDVIERALVELAQGGSAAR